jgi:hypothetical protein
MDHGVMDFLTLASKMRGENSRNNEQQRQQHHQQYSGR